MTIETVNEAWRIARLHSRLPDTPDARKAFYHGARHAFNVILHAEPLNDVPVLHALNNDLHQFVTAANAMETSS